MRSAAPGASKPGGHGPLAVLLHGQHEHRSFRAQPLALRARKAGFLFGICGRGKERSTSLEVGRSAGMRRARSTLAKSGVPQVGPRTSSHSGFTPATSGTSRIANAAPGVRFCSITTARPTQMRPPTPLRAHTCTLSVPSAGSRGDRNTHPVVSHSETGGRSQSPQRGCEGIPTTSRNMRIAAIVIAGLTSQVSIEEPVRILSADGASATRR